MRSGDIVIIDFGVPKGSVDQTQVVGHTNDNVGPVTFGRSREIVSVLFGF